MRREHWLFGGSPFRYQGIYIANRLMTSGGTIVVLMQPCWKLASGQGLACLGTQSKLPLATQESAGP